MKVNYEVTDTFGGQANYSWVNRGNIEAKDGTSDLAIVRRVKREIGWSNLRCKKEDWGDTIVLRPYGMCQICFIGP